MISSSGISYTDAFAVVFLILQMQYRLHPFSFCILAFHGFSNEDKLHMEELTVVNGMYICFC